jgi:hypothetical protein
MRGRIRGMLKAGQCCHSEVTYSLFNLSNNYYSFLFVTHTYTQTRIIVIKIDSTIAILFCARTIQCHVAYACMQ